MASSKLMTSTSSAKTDLPRPSSPHSLTVSDLQSDHSRTFGSMNMDEFLKNICNDSDSFPSDNSNSGSAGHGGGSVVQGGVGNKTVDEVWKEIVAGSNGRSKEQMTLEDFLTNAGAVSEEEVRAAGIQQAAAGFGMDEMMVATAAGANYQAPVSMQAVQKGTGAGGGFFGVDAVGYATSGGCRGVGRGKRRAVMVEESPLDKALLQKQKRMIKNRESAARSRERKQAYTVELESMVTQLEEENARLKKDEMEQNRERVKQLMENLIPVTEGQRPPRVLRKVHSMMW